MVLVFWFSDLVRGFSIAYWYFSVLLGRGGIVAIEGQSESIRTASISPGRPGLQSTKFAHYLPEFSLQHPVGLDIIHFGEGCD